MHVLGNVFTWGATAHGWKETPFVDYHHPPLQLAVQHVVDLDSSDQSCRRDHDRRSSASGFSNGKTPTFVRY